MSNIEDEADVIKDILKMGIRTENGFVYFNEILYRCMRRVYGNMLLDRSMIVFEIKTQLRIQEKTQKAENLYNTIFS